MSQREYRNFQEKRSITGSIWVNPRPVTSPMPLTCRGDDKDLQTHSPRALVVPLDPGPPSAEPRRTHRGSRAGRCGRIVGQPETAGGRHGDTGVGLKGCTGVPGGLRVTWSSRLKLNGARRLPGVRLMPRGLCGAWQHSRGARGPPRTSDLPRARCEGLLTSIL